MLCRPSSSLLPAALFAEGVPPQLMFGLAWLAVPLVAAASALCGVGRLAAGTHLPHGARRGYGHPVWLPRDPITCGLDDAPPDPLEHYPGGDPKEQSPPRQGALGPDAPTAPDPAAAQAGNHPELSLGEGGDVPTTSNLAAPTLTPILSPIPGRSARAGGSGQGSTPGGTPTPLLVGGTRVVRVRPGIAAGQPHKRGRAARTLGRLP